MNSEWRLFPVILLDIENLFRAFEKKITLKGGIEISRKGNSIWFVEIY